MSFKIIAVRPLPECDVIYSKVLQKDEFYIFNNAFSFEGYTDFSNEKIIYDVSKDIDLFSSEEMEISINAIVGKNGTGKSTLTELLYAFIFCLSLDRRIGFLKNIKVKQDHEFTFEESSRYDGEIHKMKRLHMEVYYCLDDKLYRIRKEKEFTIDQFILKDGIYSRDEYIKVMLNKRFLADNFFYSVAINYSLYGLNTNETGLWLKPLFHKNDAYQTPLVLNPMRTNGIIDINRVTYLSKSRLLSNILREIPVGTETKNSLRNLVNDKVANEIILNVDFQKFLLIKKGVNRGSIKFDYYSKYYKRVLPKILSTFCNLDEEKISEVEIIRKYRSPKLLEKIAIEYIIRKVEKIARTYPIDGKIYGEEFDLTKNILVTALLEDLETEYSHITFKLRQAVNFLLYDLDSLDKTKISHKIETQKISTEIHLLISELIEKDRQEQLHKRTSEKKVGIPSKVIPENTEIVFPSAKFELVNFLPPSFFELDILFDDLGSFSELSSGERQKVYSINSIIYHLVNLKSVDGTTRIRYDYVNLIFDEVELYFHPEFQRTFIHDLLASISRSECRFSGINITFVTHSPFILSDIPNNSILYLDIPEGKQLAEPQFKEQQTFAANIHELLSSGFFMRYTKGDYALLKITQIINFYEKVKEASDNEIRNLKEEFKNKKEEFSQICSIIGEQYIKDVLKNNLRFIETRLGVFSENTIDQKIGELTAQLEALKKLKQKND